MLFIFIFIIIVDYFYKFFEKTKRFKKKHVFFLQMKKYGFSIYYNLLAKIMYI